ncbi:MAG: acetylglutamate kinase [Verrucomicrobia bacterium]|nr:acetylglutamate kinase [Verrucomicrobiota bacterium]
MNDLIHKAATLLEALPYMQKFRDKTFVVKYGGSFMDSPDPEVRHAVARDVVFLEAAGINPVVVHGGGKAITRALNSSGMETQFVQGMRVTDEKSVAIVDHVLSREINPEIVELIHRNGGKARGIAGTDILTCRKLELHSESGEKLDPGYVGVVVAVNTGPLIECIRDHVTPVVSPTAVGIDGHVYNCNADVAAAQVAIALKACRLVFMSDVAGLMTNINDPESIISRLHVDQVPNLKSSGVIAAGMIPKVDSAVEAIRAGIEKVSFVDGRLQHSVLLEIFTHKGVGTELVL